jgi:chaperonin GroEL
MLRRFGAREELLMPFKHLMFRAAAREKILVGATALADAVRVTLGPRSKCVLIEKKWGKPIVCNDGVTIAKELNLSDPEENLGVQMIREAAERTGDAVGDGTSTSTVLAHAIFADGLRNVAAGASAIDLKRGLDKGLAVAVAALKHLSRPVASRLEKTQVATISAHNDAGIGELVAEATDRVGREGVITVEEAKATETVLDVVEGMRFDRGFISPYFVTNPDKMSAVLERPVVLLCEKRISHLNDLIPVLEEVAKQNRALLVVAEDVDGEALATLVVNKMRGLLACAAVKAPGFGDRRKESLQDLAVLTGAQVVAEEAGITLKNLTISMLGQAQKVEITKDTTTVIGGCGDKAALDVRVRELRAQVERSRSDYDREKLNERLAKLVGGVAVIRVGAASEAELKNRKEAFDDAINATKAAVDEGVVPGGGLALLRLIPELRAHEGALAGDELTGLRILTRALEVPTRQIAENSAVDGGVVVSKMLEGTGNFGFDAAEGRFVDVMEAGIIDPTKVVRVALENAVSVASVLLLTEATLTDVPEKTETSEGLGASPLA